MSWKAGLSRYLPCLRFFACPESPSSNGIMNYYTKNYDTLRLLNPNLPLMMRTTDNAMPAVTTELDFTKTHVVEFLLQTHRVVPHTPEYDAAQAYLQAQSPAAVAARSVARWTAMPGFDPARPGRADDDPAWRDHLSPDQQHALAPYFHMTDAVTQSLAVLQAARNGQLYTEAENALLMCQRVDLWCAGEAEVERALQHLYLLGRALNNDRTVDFPAFIADFVPGAPDFDNL